MLPTFHSFSSSSLYPCSNFRNCLAGLFTANVHGLQQVGGFERKKVHIDVVSLKELIDGCGNLPLKIGHDDKSSLIWILQRFSLGLEIRSNDLIGVRTGPLSPLWTSVLGNVSHANH